MGNKLVLIGGGGHCKSVIDTAKRLSRFDEIVVTDPIISIGESILGCKVVGSDDSLGMLREIGFDYAFITVGCVNVSSTREKLVDKAKVFGFKFPTIVDPSSVVSESAFIGEGAFLGKNVIINAGSTIGRHSIVNSGSIIEHDCEVGDFSHVSVGTIICGDVIIGENSMIGAGSTIIQSVRIGNHVLIGANSTVLTNVPDNAKEYGVIHSYSQK